MARINGEASQGRKSVYHRLFSLPFVGWVRFKESTVLIERMSSLQRSAPAAHSLGWFAGEQHSFINSIKNLFHDYSSGRIIAHHDGVTMGLELIIARRAPCSFTDRVFVIIMQSGCSFIGWFSGEHHSFINSPKNVFRDYSSGRLIAHYKMYGFPKHKKLTVC